MSLMSQQAVRQPRRLCVGLVKRPGSHSARARNESGVSICAEIRMRSGELAAEAESGIYQ